MKRRLIIGTLVIAAIMLVYGAGMMASASPGTQTDPFITVSYLTNIFKPQVMTDVEKTEKELVEKFEARIAALEQQLQSGQGGSSPTSPDAADKFNVVTLSRGQSLSCSVGTELILRIGTANGVGTAPSLVNTTSGTTLSSGTALTANNAYLVTIEGNGITATADTVRVMVRGTYRIT